MPDTLQVVIVYNKSNTTLENTANILSYILPSLGREVNHSITSIKILDVREPPRICDICIHLEEPYAVWFPWAKSNCIFSDVWNNSWNGYIDSFDVGIRFSSPVNFRHHITLPWKQMISNNLSNDFKICFKEMIQECVNAIEHREEIPREMPPLLQQENCPSISIITLVYNRPKFIENACLNLLSTDYPKEKIEWVVIDDSEPDKSPSNRVIQFQEQFPGVVTYIPLVKKTSIGQKRNIAIEKAKHDIILMMDDDDHYPVTSFRRRVAYLLKGRKQYECAVCTTIAMYDLQTGISAVNVPPYDLGLGQRCSEATLTFTRNFWISRKFGDISLSEGEEFLTERENQIVEMPPQQIIVALSNGTNTSRRKTPEGNPGCFWGFPRELLEFLHGLVGVKIEE
jgi:hypothetical protein